MNKTYTNRDLSDKFVIAIQFIDRDGETQMSLTTNDSDVALNITSMRIHGMNLAENHTQLDDKDHEGLQAFCRTYLEKCGYYVR